MPGYEVERFVSLSQNEKSELICSICQDIFRCPVVAQCCQQSFCEECIDNWLKTNSTCPYDRKTLTQSELTRPPRVMLNMLGRLRISCDFKVQGCRETVILENLSQHTAQCGYNVDKFKKCKKCFVEYPEMLEHDCIELLLELIRKANKENETLKCNSSLNTVIPTAPPIVAESRPVSHTVNSIEQILLTENRELKKEKENLLITIQNLTNQTDLLTNANSSRFSTGLNRVNPNPGPAIRSSYEKKISEQEIFNQARTHISSEQIIDNKLKEDVMTNVRSIIRAEFEECNSMFVFCTNIVKKLDTEYGSRWHCIASHQKPISSSYSYEVGHQIRLSFGDLQIEIYKTEFFNVKELKQRFRNGKIKREIQISYTDMKQNMISEVKKITFAAIEKSDTLADISSELETQLEKRYPGEWQCLLYAYHCHYSFTPKLGTYINFDLDRLTLILFQDHRDQNTTK